MIPGLHQAIAAAQRQATGAMTEVVIRWVTEDGGTEDPVTGQLTGGTRTEQSLTRQALAHHATAEFKFNHMVGVEVGDLILDFSGHEPLDLTGKKELTFTVAGKTWLPKQDHTQATASPDAVVGNRVVFETLVLQPAPNP